MTLKINVLDVQEPYLREKLPNGYSLEFQPGVTLVVGPNGSGKTAFLRLLYTSLGYDLRRESYASRTKRVEKFEDEFEDRLLKVVSDEKLYPLTRFNETSPTETSNKNDSRTYKKAFLKSYKGFHNRPGRGEGEKSSGQLQLHEMEKFFCTIDGFYMRDDKVFVYRGRGTGITGEQAGALLYSHDYSKIEKESNPIILMDEPTVFLDYWNSRRFFEIVRKYQEKYPDMHMFITTNDGIMIEHAFPDWKFLDFRKAPVSFSEKEEIISSLKSTNDSDSLS